MSTDQIQSQPEIQQDSQPQPDIQNINDSQQVQQMLNEETQNIASIAEGGRELSKTVLYVGNIHRSVSDEAIQDLFNSLGNPIKSIKVLQDKNKPGFNYAFIEFDTAEATTNALQALNGTTVADNQLKITKAFQTQQIKNSDTFNLFIGDLSLEVNDELLNSSFQKFPSLVQANVMWDMKSGRSRGYGFVCFVDKKDAEEALQTMNGFVLGDRPIRLNWASHRDHNNNNNNNQNHNHYHYNNNNNNQNMNYYNNNNNNNNNNMNYNNHYNNNNNMNGINNMNNNPTTNNSNNNMNSSMNNNMNMMNMNMMNNSSFNASNSSTNSNGMLVNNNSNTNTSNMNVNNMGNLNNINNMNHINNGNKVRNNMMTMNSMDMINNQQNGGNINGVNNRMPIMGPPSYEMVLRQTPNWLSVVYLGNLADYTTQNDLIPLLQNFGYIVNFKLLSDKGCAFVTYDTHERAALAIVQLSGFTINGRPLKCGWGKANKVVGNMRNVPPGIRN